MKKIILNGCSWIAGDEILWEKFLQEKGEDTTDPALAWQMTGLRPKYAHVIINEYRELYRPQFNQSGMLNKELETDVIDLSQDGNSNDSICLSTINYMLGISAEDRQNYHIIIGWTIKERKLLYLKDYYWRNVHVGHLQNNAAQWIENKNRLTGAILEETDNDWYLNYFKNVIMLENFLKWHNISYTFYRSLGSTDEFYDFDANKIYNQPKMDIYKVTDQKTQLNNLVPSLSDSNNWLTFFEEEQHRNLASQSWTKYMQKKFQPTWQWHISDSNRHPNLKATTILVDIIKNHLIKNNLL